MRSCRTSVRASPCRRPWPGSRTIRCTFWKSSSSATRWSFRAARSPRSKARRSSPRRTFSYYARRASGTTRAASSRTQRPALKFVKARGYTLANKRAEEQAKLEGREVAQEGLYARVPNAALRSPRRRTGRSDSDEWVWQHRPVCALDAAGGCGASAHAGHRQGGQEDRRTVCRGDHRLRVPQAARHAQDHGHCCGRSECRDGRGRLLAAGAAGCVAPADQEDGTRHEELAQTHQCRAHRQGASRSSTRTPIEGQPQDDVSPSEDKEEEGGEKSRFFAPKPAEGPHSADVGVDVDVDVEMADGVETESAAASAASTPRRKGAIISLAQLAAAPAEQ
ncbi:hypothetical protein L1887_50212 [Cichorium endivia]|nr:hypothetical protein L1887_50212 [Cichorium endivia]